MEFIITTQDEITNRSLWRITLLFLTLIIAVIALASNKTEFVIGGALIITLTIFGSFIISEKPHTFTNTPETTKTIIQKINNQPEYSNVKEAPNSSKQQLIIQLDHKNNTYSCTQTKRQILPIPSIRPTTIKKTIERSFTCTIK